MVICTNRLKKGPPWEDISGNMDVYTPKYLQSKVMCDITMSSQAEISRIVLAENRELEDQVQPRIEQELEGKNKLEDYIKQKDTG